MSMRYLSARLAQQIDEELMGAAGAFSIDQLMELAGLACAQTLATVYPKDRYPRVLVCCGPGNQGGDGLVAARHLGMFGYKPQVYMPKPGSKDIYKRLAKQCENMEIPILPPTTDVSDLENALKSTDVIMDAIFGFSFKPPIRAPFDKALPLLAESRLPIVSVDIPSGWDVEEGNKAGLGLNPNVLLSLTAPKLGVKDFTGRHFLGGRFVPKSLEKKFELGLPPYPGVEQIVELDSEDKPGELPMAGVFVNVSGTCLDAMQTKARGSTAFPSIPAPDHHLLAIMPKRQRNYSIFHPPSLEMSELVKTTLDHDSTDMLIEKWLEHRSNAHDAYHDWFRDVRERKLYHRITSHMKQIIAWNKGEFVPENVFCRTVDTGRLIPLDRTWTTHVYHHHSMSERKLSMLPVVFTMLPELMLLRGMHDTGCDEIYIIVTDLKRQEMDDATEYFKLVCRHCYGQPLKPSVERRIQAEHMRLSHKLLSQHRTPCFPQIDLTLRAILHEKRPRFLVLFSHQTTSYSQIFFTHPSYVPDEEIFYDYPTGCPNPCCTDDCEMIRFPRRGLETAPVLQIRVPSRKKKGGKEGDGGGRTLVKGRVPKVKAKEMCNWIDCDVCFGEIVYRHAHRPRRGDQASSSESSGASTSGESTTSCSSEDGGLEDEERVEGADVVPKKVNHGQLCSKCKLVKYCSPEHQRMDWEEHKRVCVRN